MWRVRETGFGDSWNQRETQVAFLQLYLDHLDLSGDIDLRGGNGDLGGDVMKGNVYVDGRPVCDDGWGAEEAKVIFRLDTLVRFPNPFSSQSRTQWPCNPT